jgi:hypothetical protein
MASQTYSPQINSQPLGGNSIINTIDYYNRIKRMQAQIENEYSFFIRTLPRKKKKKFKKAYEEAIHRSNASIKGMDKVVKEYLKNRNHDQNHNHRNIC